MSKYQIDPILKITEQRRNVGEPRDDKCADPPPGEESVQNRRQAGVRCPLTLSRDGGRLSQYLTTKPPTQPMVKRGW